MATPKSQSLAAESIAVKCLRVCRWNAFVLCFRPKTCRLEKCLWRQGNELSLNRKRNVLGRIMASLLTHSISRRIS